MRIEDQFYVSGRGTVVTGTLDEGEPWPRLGPIAAMRGSTFFLINVIGIELSRALTDPPITSRTVGLVIGGLDKDFDLRGTYLSFERRRNAGYAGGERRHQKEGA